jgi:hypothetical protein
MNAFTIIFLVIFIAACVTALLSKVKNNDALRRAVSMLMIAGIIYYAVAPILLFPIPIPCTLIARCIAYVFVLVSLKGLVLSMLE